MTLLLARTAQAIYVRAGYGREQAFNQGQIVADYLIRHLDECRCQFGTQDEFELARMLAMSMLGPARTSRAA
jgi:hypothetical protein